jgi:hypothetical protein
MQNQSLPGRTIYFPLVLQYGLMAAVAISLLNFSVYAADWVLSPQLWMWAMIKLANGALLITFYFLFARAVRKAEGGHTDFLTLFVHCLFLAFAIGLATSAYDLVFYHYIDPEFDVKVMEMGRKVFLESAQRQGMSEAEKTEMLKSMDTVSKQLAETHASGMRTVLNALSSELLPGGVLGVIMGVVMRRRY